MQRFDLKNFEPQELEAFVLEQGWEAYRAHQIMSWLYKRRIADIDRMTDLSRTIRDKLQEKTFASRFCPSRVDTGDDGTRKYLFALDSGYGVESVLIPERDHYTVCLSTQLGCALGCRFCYTGRMGLIRNLNAAEILNQLAAVLDDLGDQKLLRNIVFMGMGEPLANYENTRKALELIFYNYGFGFSHRRVTISTAGLIPQIKRLGRENPVNLAVSLNAADDETREFLMPVNRTYPLKALVGALEEYPLKNRKRITIEYVLIAGVNDSQKDAERLAVLLRRIRCKINLIPLNQHPGVEFKRPSLGRIDEFKNILISHNYTAIVRESKGRDICAACGQLGGTQKSEL